MHEFEFVEDYEHASLLHLASLRADGYLTIMQGLEKTNLRIQLEPRGTRGYIEMRAIKSHA